LTSKPSIKKPIMLFVISIFTLTVFIIAIKDIRLPDVPFLKGENPKSIERTEELNIKPEDRKITLKLSDFDKFLSKCCNAVIKNTRSDYQDGAIKLEGKAIVPFPAAFTGSVDLYVEDTKIKAKTKDLVLGKVESPEMFEEKIEPLLQKGLDENINSKYKVKDVKIESKGIEIEIE